MPLLRLTVLLLVAAAFSARSQEPLARVNVQLLQVEAVVTDSHGRRVPDLQREDFQLLVDGKEKEIATLSFVDGGKSPAAPNGPLRREDVHRTIVFLIDELHTAPEHVVELAPIVRRFADEQVSPGDLVSVMATRNSMGVYEQFTSDPKRIHAALERMIRLAGTHFNQINSPDRDQYDSAGLIDASNAYFMDMYHGVSMVALSRAIEGLRGMPGRKAIVWLSDGIEFPLSQLGLAMGEHKDSSFIQRMEDRTRYIANMANRAGVAIYCFDTKTLESVGFIRANIDDPVRAASLQNVPNLLANATGGIFAHDTNQLSEALGRAMQDMTGYYLIGYVPKQGEFEDKEGVEINRRVRVKVKRPGLSVRTRSNFGPDLRPDAPAQTREELMRQTLLSPFSAGGIRLQLTPLYSASPPDPKTGARHALLRALLSVDGRDLHGAKGDDGKSHVVLDIASVAHDVNNKVVASEDQRQAVELSGAQLTLFYSLDIPIPGPGAFSLRVAVREPDSGAAGSAATFIEIPDFNKPRLALSSVVLTDEGKARATHSFAVGKRIQYALQVYGARTGKQHAAPQVDLTMRLYRGRERVFASEPIRIESERGDKQVAIEGSFLIPADFPEGEYSLELVIDDKLAEGKKKSASQWADLTLRR